MWWRYVNEPCNCDAYPFPHRIYGGDCEGEQQELTLSDIAEEIGDIKYHTLKEDGLI